MKTGTLLLAFVILSSPAAADLADNKPDNITLELSFEPSSSVYIDGSQISSSANSKTVNSPIYPYIVSDQPTGIIGLSNVEQIKYVNSSKDTFSVTQTGNEFILPFTQGGHETIEDDEELILNNEFFNGLEPSFSFFRPENPVVKAMYIFEQPIVEYNGPSGGIDTLTVRNKLNGKNLTEFVVQAN